LLTAVATAASASAQTTAEAQPAQNTEDANILEVPAGVANASSIPITVKIPAKYLQPSTSLAKVKIELFIQKGPQDESDRKTVFVAELVNNALPTANANGDIVMMTRLKIPPNPWAAPAPPPPPPPPPPPAPAQAPTQLTANLNAVITISFNGVPDLKKTAHQPVTILPQDCATTNAALLRLALQPTSFPKNGAVYMKAVVPPVIAPAPVAPAAGPPPAPPVGPPPAAAQLRMLQTITCQTSGTTCLTMNGISYLADEVFVSFSLYPPGDSVIAMAWTYTPATPNTNLTASIYATMNPS
jgi:hypothetical protein